MRKRYVLLSLLLVVMLAFAATGVALGKAHVPLGKVQVAHKGTAITVSANALDAHLRHGDFQLPACDFNNVFQTRDDVSDLVDGDDDGFADYPANTPAPGELPLPRDEAAGVTEACPVGSF